MANKNRLLLALTDATVIPLFPQSAQSHANVQSPATRTLRLPIEVNVVNGILEGDLDLLPHHGSSGLGGSGHTAGGSSDGRGGGGRCGLFIWRS